MGDVKTELKAARELIKQKEYKEALKHCKNVLKVDKGNYNGLVFIGVCATELEQFDQAKQAYRKAIDANSEHILAWQGLCTCMEKANNVLWNGELVDVYSTLLDQHLKESDKWPEYCGKLVNLLKAEKRPSDAAHWIKTSLGRQWTFSAQKDLISVLKEQFKIEQDEGILSEIYVQYKKTCDSEHGSAVVSLDYLNFIIQHAHFEYNEKPSLNDTHTIAQSMVEKFPGNMDIFETFCVVWMNVNLENLEPDDKMLCLATSLLEANPSSHIAHLLVGLGEFNNDNISKAHACVQRALSIKNNDPIALYISAKCFFVLHKYKMAGAVLQEALKTCSKVEFKESGRILTKLLLVTQVELLLLGWETENHSKEILVFMDKLDDSFADQVDVVLLKVKVALKLKQGDRALKLLSEFEQFPVENPALQCELMYVKALMSQQEENYFDAELRLLEALEIRDKASLHFLLGDIYMCIAKQNDDNQSYYPKAYNAYLKAAKLDSLYPITFQRLGEYQRDFVKDFNKSVKCFEKALSLHPMNGSIVRSLADLHMHMDQPEKAIGVFDSFTSKSPSGSAIWAWVRLGLLNLKSNADRAVVCFQHAIRGGSNISHYWECLAEAYFTKGSFTSSLRAFTKALELDPSSLFCKFKIAKIRQMLSMDAEAIEVYTDVLRTEPTYLPALLGLAQSHLHLQKEKLTATLDGRAVDHAQAVVDNVSIALKDQPTYTCLWKTIADSLCSLHVVSKDQCKLYLPENLVKMLKVGDACLVTKVSVMEVAEKCYMMAIKFREDVATLWNDLAVCTFYHGMALKGQIGEQKILQSMNIIKKALTLDPGNHSLWNTLGVIAGSPGPSQKVCGMRINDIQNPGLSQHAFIKSLQLNDLDAHVWCNLGSLYLQYDKVMPAHEAFKRAQACDPSVVEAWVGQAIIAECVANEEAMDLFRHATTLSFHGEGSVAYAQWVCRLLKSVTTSTHVVSTTKPLPDMSHMPAYAKSVVANATVALMKSVQRLKSDACAFNTLGLLLEQQTLYKQAESAFASARKLLHSNPDQERQAELLRMVLMNQARVLCELKKYDDAIEIYRIISLQTVTEFCGLALAYFLSGQFEKCLKTYEEAFSLTSSDAEKSAILSAIGMVHYSMNDADSAKSYLLQGSQFNDKAEHGLMALCALGLLHGDGTLATAALVELKNHKLATTAALVEKQAMLLCAFYMLQGHKTAAQRTLMKAIFRFPNNAHLWSRMSKYITENNPSKHTSAIHCAKVALVLHQSKDTSKTTAFVSLAFPTSSDSRRFMKSVQRFVHNHPELAESWAMLSAQLIATAAQKTIKETETSVINMASLALSKADDTVNSLRKSSNSNSKHASMYTSLYSWTMKCFVTAHVFFGEVKTAHAFCNQIIPSLSGDKQRQEQFIFLKGFASMHEDILKKDGPALENLRVMAALTATDTATWKWTILSFLYVKFGMPVCAELCLRRVMQFNIQKNIDNTSVLFSMCVLCMQVFWVSSEVEWLEKALQVMAELLRVAEVHPLTIFLRALLFRMEGKDKAALKYLQKLTYCEDAFVSGVQEKLVSQWK